MDDLCDLDPIQRQGLLERGEEDLDSYLTRLCQGAASADVRFKPL